MHVCNAILSNAFLNFTAQRWNKTRRKQTIKTIRDEKVTSIYINFNFVE